MSENNSLSRFNAYEYIGVIAPGSVLCLGVMLLWPETKTAILSQEVTVGEFGIFVIVAFVAGHLLQFLGNLIESVLWRFFGGMPTCWVLKSRQNLLSSKQRENLEKIIMHNKAEAKLLNDFSAKEWYPVVREMYVLLNKEGRTGRVDAFNRNYGLLRGIASAFLLLALLVIVKEPLDYKISLIILFFGIAPALYRMFRFGRNYGRELLVEYINHEKGKI